MTKVKAKRKINERIIQLASFITPARVESLLSRIVDIPSESGNEGKALKFVEQYLSQHQTEFTRQYLSKGRYNLIVFGDRNSKDTILLNTHIDTVPSYLDEQQTSNKRGRFIYGRGTCDAKGSLTAMLLAYLAVVRYTKQKLAPVTLSIVSGEESTGDGAEKFVQEYDNFSYAIVGEPTDLKIATSQAGYVELLVESESTISHAFDPVSEQSIMLMIRAISKIERIVASVKNQRIYCFVRWIKGGGDSGNAYWYTRPNCKGSLLMNIYPDSKVKPTMKKIRTTLKALSQESRGASIKVRVKDKDYGTSVLPTFWGVLDLSDGLRAVGVKSCLSHFPSWTDGATLSAAGIPTIVFGPGSLKGAHTMKERVSVKQVEKAAMAMAIAILRRCEESM